MKTLERNGIRLNVYTREEVAHVIDHYEQIADHYIRFRNLGEKAQFVIGKAYSYDCALPMGHGLPYNGRGYVWAYCPGHENWGMPLCINGVFASMLLDLMQDRVVTTPYV